VTLNIIILLDKDRANRLLDDSSIPRDFIEEIVKEIWGDISSVSSSQKKPRGAKSNV